MGWIGLAQLIIALTQGLLSGLTSAKAPQEILDALQTALGLFQKVHGTLVTKAQVDSVTLDFRW